jgi:inorganic pyrophosphatase
MSIDLYDEVDKQTDQDYVNSLFRKINTRKRIVSGPKNSTPYMHHPWHNVEIGQAIPDVINVVIEIPMESRVKTELDKTTGLLKVDRILHSSIVYPANYGFVPQTLAADRDPLDVLVLCQLSVPPLCIMRVRPIGLMPTVDSGTPDDKVIGVCVTDPEYNVYYDVSELPPYKLAIIKQFFDDYKILEKGSVKTFSPIGAGKAKRTIRDAHTAYLEHYHIEP